ncbi:class I ribonucleotide reductase maintenance protein YfaE [Psychromonas aquatilis]|uniref:Class I ribonucleotide reductase maintenance protein YfaE n=1 Tax=Psychromonas aquatilis TaxID=2005072 RepID=A0ABU9GST0_9GAMM
MKPTLTYNNKQYPLDTQKTLLENLESQAVPVEFQCRDGYCGACCSVIESGEVNYQTTPMAYLRDKEVLLCCSKSTQSITIKSK